MANSRAKSWNPMRDDYSDPNFNVYVNQGFKVATSSASSRGDVMSQAQSKTHELHVSRIPIDLSEAGLQNLFSQYGSVVKIFIAKPKLALNQKSNLTWGKVTLASLNESQRAIENLHMKPPHFLVISHSISNEARDKDSREKELRDEHSDMINKRIQEYEDKKGTNIVSKNELTLRNLQMTNISEQNMFPKLQKGGQRVDVDGMSSGREDDWFLNMKPTNIQVPLNITVQPTFDHTPFIYGHPKVFSSSLMGRCGNQLCDRDGRVRCSVCKDWYCSQSCQVKDWPQHKFQCRPLPQLENPDGSVYVPSSTLREPSKERPKSVNPVKDTTESSNGDQSVLVPEKVTSSSQKAHDLVQIKGDVDKITEMKKSKDAKQTHQTSDSKNTTVSKESEAVQRHSPLPESLVVSNSKTYEPIDKHMASKSILEYFDKGEDFVICVDSATDEVSTFLATVADEKVIQYLCSDLSKLEGIKVENVLAGDFVLTYDNSEKSYARSFVLEIDEKVEVIDIDTLKPGRVERSNLFKYPSDAALVPAGGVCLLSRGNIPDHLDKYITSLVEKSSNELVVRMKEKTITTKGFFRSCIGVLMENGKNLYEYLIQPWTAMDARIPKLLGFQVDQPASCPKFEDMINTRLQVSDKLAFLKFGPSSNQLIVVNETDIVHEEQIGETMDQVKVGGKPVDFEIEKGQVLACLWSEDGSFYRALVNQVNHSLKKVRVRFIDYGDQSEEPFENLRQLPEKALKLPVMAKLVTLSDVPGESYKNSQVASRLNQLQPLLEVQIEVKSVNPDKSLVLVHPNGTTINDLINNKLKEEMDTPMPMDIQGQEIGNHYDYDKAHTAAFNTNKPQISQTAIVLNADSPTSIYLCPLDQIGVADKIAEQVEAYAKIDTAMVGYAPAVGKLCVVQSKEDNGWYRGACVRLVGDEFDIFFVDYGFHELLPRNRIKMMDPLLMKTVFLANHCILDGFENEDLVESYQKKFGEIIQKRFPFATEVKLNVLRQHAQKGYYVIKLGRAEDLNPAEVKVSSIEDEKKKKIQELEAQLMKLRTTS